MAVKRKNLRKRSSAASKESRLRGVDEFIREIQGPADGTRAVANDLGGPGPDRL
ncbi:MAG: hypothetical protein V1929_08885 [bacterium]